ncbi:MAG: rod shape-determining protein MreC [Deltaproteobacteria bacterium]|nr:MAG: rod shape-determining protein MreC [Deltaproteobacteria bacterium]HDG97016.1 rod shape-determining protein MreC [Desulfobacterales bacterium]
MKDSTPFRKAWIWAVLIIIALLLLSSESGTNRQWNLLDKIVVETTGPLQRLFTYAVDAVENFWLEYFYLVGVRRENRELRRQVQQLMLENSRYRELLSTYERLQALLKFKETFKEPVAAARVIGRDPSGWFRSVIVDKGEIDGITMDMPVVNARGVVGRIVSVSPHYSKVLLIIDQNSSVDCLIQRTRDRGMVKGLSEELCEVAYIVKSSDVRLDDVVITSGLGGVFPKGLPLGKVIRVEQRPGELFKEVEMRPAVDFSKLEEVLIILRKSTPFE